MKSKFLTLGILVLLTSCSGTRPESLGIYNGKFKSCKKLTNCFSSQSNNSINQVSPIKINSSTLESKAKIKKIINSLPRTKLITEKSDYLHYEFTTLMMRFVDDVELYFDEEKKIIHIKSASRLGTEDFGVNKNRINTIKNLYNKSNKE